MSESSSRTVSPLSRGGRGAGVRGKLQEAWRVAAERFFGKRIRRFEDPRLLAGNGGFLEDQKLPGMLHAAFVRSPYAHATINEIPVKAGKVPGVVAVFT